MSPPGQARRKSIHGWTNTATGQEQVKFLPCDLGDPASLEAHRNSLQQVRSVVHLGGFVLRSSRPEDDNPLEAIRLNVEGTIHLLQHLPASLASFCYTSTLDVYGVPQCIPVTEDHPTRPATFYAASKLATENLLRVWEQRTGIPVTILRLSQVYGPEDSSNKAIPAFIKAILRGEPLIVMGDGSDVRDYVFVDDVVSAVLRALAQGVSGTFNIANGQGCTIGEIASMLLRLAGNPYSPTYKPSPRPPVHMVLNIERAKAHLGYEPRVTLTEGLRQTVEGCRRLASQ